MTLSAHSTTASYATTSITIPSTVLAGDFAVIFNVAASNGSLPAAVTPSGWDQIVTANGQNTSALQTRGSIIAKILDGSEANQSITLMDGTYNTESAILVVFRDDSGTVTSYSNSTPNGQVSNSAPTNQSVNAASASGYPVVVFAGAGSTGSPTLGSTPAFGTAYTNPSNSQYKIGYTIYASSASNHTVTCSDAGNTNVLESVYFVLTVTAGPTTYNQSLTASITGTASIRKTVNKTVSASSTLTATMSRLVTKGLSATITSAASICKTVGKTLSASITGTASLARLTLRSVMMSASLTLSASMSRTIEKRLSASLDSAASIQKTVMKLMAADVPLTASLSRALGVTLTASLGMQADIRRTIEKLMAADVSLAASISRIKLAIVVMTADLTLSASLATIRLFTMLLEASVTMSAGMQRTISKTMEAALPVVARPIRWVASMYAAIRGDRPNWNMCARCSKKMRPNKLRQQMEWRGERQVWTGLYVCWLCEDEPQPLGRVYLGVGNDPRPVPNARPRRR